MNPARYLKFKVFKQASETATVLVQHQLVNDSLKLGRIVAGGTAANHAHQGLYTTRTGGLVLIHSQQALGQQTTGEQEMAVGVDNLLLVMVGRRQNQVQHGVVKSLLTIARSIIRATATQEQTTALGLLPQFRQRPVLHDKVLLLVLLEIGVVTLIQQAEHALVQRAVAANAATPGVGRALHPQKVVQTAGIIVDVDDDEFTHLESGMIVVVLLEKSHAQVAVGGVDINLLGLVDALLIVAVDD